MDLIYFVFHCLLVLQFYILRETKKDIGVCVIFLILPFLFYLYGSSYKENLIHQMLQNMIIK